MPYSLTTQQIAALSTDYCQSVDTITEYESSAFQTNVEAQITAANELDDGFKSVWKSHFDDINLLETENNQLTGLLINNAITLNSENEGQVTRPDQTKTPVVDITFEPLVNVGKVSPTVERITAVAVRDSNSSTLIDTEPEIRTNVNRFWPARVDNNNIYKAETLFPLGVTNALTSADAIDTALNQLVNNIFFYSPILNRQDNNVQLINSTSKVVDISDNERYFQFMTDNLIPTPTSFGGTTKSIGDTPAGSNFVATSIRGVEIGGTVTITTNTSGTSGMNPTPAPTPDAPVQGDIIQLSAVQVIMLSVSSTTVTNAGGEMSTPTKVTTSVCNFLRMAVGSIASSPSVASGNSTNGSQGTALINSYNSNLKRFSFANNTALDTRIGVIRTSLGAIDTANSFYDNRYLAANTRSNLNNGTLGLVESKNSLKTNLFPPTDGGTDPNEYTRLIEKRDYIETVFAGNTPPINNPTCPL